MVGFNEVVCKGPLLLKWRIAFPLAFDWLVFPLPFPYNNMDFFPRVCKIRKKSSKVNMFHCGVI